MQKKSSNSVRVFYPKFNKKEIIQLLLKKLEKLANWLPLIRVVLFGSYAKGNYTVRSDIDLLVIYKGEEREEAFTIVKKALDIPGIEPHVYSEKVYKSMEGTLNKMVESGIALYPEPNISHVEKKSMPVVM
jgi:predicted nucleotidyltransferase